MLARVQHNDQDRSPQNLAHQWELPIPHELGDFRMMTIEDFKKEFAIPEHLAGPKTFNFLVNAGFFRE